MLPRLDHPVDLLQRPGLGRARRRSETVGEESKGHVGIFDQLPVEHFLRPITKLGYRVLGPRHRHDRQVRWAAGIPVPLAHGPLDRRQVLIGNLGAEISMSTVTAS